ncbi:MAG: hypothetical protein KC621_20820, partial [Myxococcales bacterium]|nr:hypothetical protein [Myxococcales bacterium]
AAPVAATPAPVKTPTRSKPPVSVAADAAPSAPGALPPPQTPMAPPIAEAALQGMNRDQAVEHLKAEMAKVHVLQQRVAELEDQLRRSKGREKDLVDLVAKWQSQG